MEKLLSEEDWGRLQNVLHGRDSKWQAVGIQLHVAHDELTKIKQEHGHNLEECNRAMQIAWLKSGKATWKALVAALSSGPVGLLEDAKRVEEKYLQPEPHDQQRSTLSALSCPTELMVNQHVQKSLLNEQLEWLIKMGFTVEDIVEWALNKQKLSDGETFDNNIESPRRHGISSAPHWQPVPNDIAPVNITLCANTACTEPPRLPSTPEPVLSPVAQSTPMDKDNTQTPNGGEKRTLMKTRSRKRSNTSQGRQPKAKHGRTSKASLVPSPSKQGRRACLRSPLRSSVEESQESLTTVLKEKMFEVLDLIEEHAVANEFVEPVNRERATNYYDVITEPMCLAVMATKVFEGIYETPRMFCDDFDLIIQNCEAYNGAESIYTQQAMELKEEFYQLVSIYFDDSEVDQRHSTMISRPRAPEPTSTPPSTAGEESSIRIRSARGSASTMCSEEVLHDEGGVSGPGQEMVQLPHTCSITTAASNDNVTSGSSDDDLPSFMNLFTNSRSKN